MRRPLTLALTLLVAAPGAATAQLVTTPFAGGVTATSFSCAFDYCFGAGPLAVGAPGYGVTYSATIPGTNEPAGSISGGTGLYTLGTNGAWTGAAGAYAGTDAASIEGGMRFTFDVAVSAVGSFMSYRTPPFSSAVFIRALGAGGGILAEYDLLADAPIAGAAAEYQEFRGIARAEGDIYGYEMVGSYAVTRDLMVVPATVVPEPATVLLLATGLAGLAAGARLGRRRR